MERRADGLFRLLVIGVTGVILVAAAKPVLDIALGAGTAWAGEVRHGVVAGQGFSVAIASVSGTQPRIPVGSLSGRAETGLFVFDVEQDQLAEIERASGRFDVAWLDSSLDVIWVDQNLGVDLTNRPVSTPPGKPALFLFVAPSGSLDLRRGDRLTLL